MSQRCGNRRTGLVCTICGRHPSGTARTRMSYNRRRLAVGSRGRSARSNDPAAINFALGRATHRSAMPARAAFLFSDAHARDADGRTAWPSRRAGCVGVRGGVAAGGRVGWGGVSRQYHSSSLHYYTSICRIRQPVLRAPQRANAGARAVARSRCEPSSAGTRRAAGRTAAGWHSQGGPPRGFPARPFRPTTAG